MVERLDRRKFLRGMVGAGALAMAPVVGPAMINEIVTQETRKKLAQMPKHEWVVPTLGSVQFGGWWPNYLDGQHKDFSSRVSVITTFHEFFDETWGGPTAIFLADQGKTDMVSVYAKQSIFRMSQMANFEEITRKKLREFGNSSWWLRFGFEMNGDWFSHGARQNSAKDFVQGWRILTKWAREESPGVKMVWTPNSGLAFEQFYPGDDVVDIVGLDVYNKSSTELNMRMFQPNLHFEEMTNPDVYILDKLSTKPKILSEVGIDRQNSMGQRWWRDVLEIGPQLGFAAICLFSENKDQHGNDEADWDWLSRGGWSVMSNLIATLPAYQMNQVG